MSKKDKKKSKKLKLGGLIQIIFTLAILGAGYALYNPEIVPDPDLKLKTIEFRSQLLSHFNQQQQHLTSKYPQLTDLSSIASKITSSQILGTSEINVDGVISSLTQELSTLPQAEIERIKRNFCEDMLKLNPDSSSSSSSGIIAP